MQILIEKGTVERPAVGITIYTLTGDTRETQAATGERIILRRQFSAVYVMEFGENYGEWRYAVAADELSERFNAIVTQWSTGEE